MLEKRGLTFMFNLISHRHQVHNMIAQNDSVHIDNAAVEAASEDLLLNSFEAVAEKADLQVSKAEVAQNAPVQVGAEKHKLNVLAKPWSTYVLDELCSEEEYQQQSGASPRSPPNQCKICGKSFGSGKALNNHVTRTRGAWLLSSGGATSTSTCFGLVADGVWKGVCP